MRRADDTRSARKLPALAMEDFKRRAKVDMNFIPYASASKIAVDVMGGHLDVGVSGLPALLEHIKGTATWATRTCRPHAKRPSPKAPISSSGPVSSRRRGRLPPSSTNSTSPSPRC